MGLTFTAKNTSAKIKTILAAIKAKEPRMAIAIKADKTTATGKLTKPLMLTVLMTELARDSPVSIIASGDSEGSPEASLPIWRKESITSKIHSGFRIKA